MSITIFMQLHLTPEGAASSRNGGFAATFKDTRAFDGCELIHAYADESDPQRFVIFERWKSREHYQRYLEWRRSTGYLEKSSLRMVSPPVVQHTIEIA